MYTSLTVSRPSKRCTVRVRVRLVCIILCMCVPWMIRLVWENRWWQDWWQDCRMGDRDRQGRDCRGCLRDQVWDTSENRWQDWSRVGDRDRQGRDCRVGDRCLRDQVWDTSENRMEPSGRQGQRLPSGRQVLEGPSVGHFREQVAGLEPSGQARERLPSGEVVPSVRLVEQVARLEQGQASEVVLEGQHLFEAQLVWQPVSKCTALVWQPTSLKRGANTSSKCCVYTDGSSPNCINL